MSSNLLGLNELEKKVYTVLSVSGQLSLPEIVANTGFDYETIKKALAQLEEKGLVIEVPGLVGRYAVVLPLKPAAEKLQQKASQVELFPSKLEATVKENLSKVKEALDALLKTLEESEQEAYTRGVNSLKGKKTETFEVMTSELKDLSARLTSQMDEEKNTIILKIRVLQTSLEETMDSVSKLLENLENNYVSMLNEFVNQTRGKTQEKIASLPAQPSAINLLPEAQSDLGKTIEDIISSQNNYTNQVYSKLNEDYNVILSKLKLLEENISAHLDELIGQSNNWKEASTSFLTDFEQQINETINRFNEISSNNSAAFREALNNMFSTRSQNIQKLETETTQFIDSEEKEIASTKTSLVGAIDNINGKFISGIETIKSEWENVLVQSVEEEKGFEEGLKTSFNSMIQELVKEFTLKSSELYNTFSKNFLENLEKRQAQKKEILSSKAEELRKLIEESRGQLNQRIETLTADINSRLSELKATFDTVINEMKINNSAFKEDELKLLQDFESNFENMRNEFLQSINRINMTIKASIAKQTEELVSMLESEKKGSIENLETNIELLNNSVAILKDSSEKQLAELETLKNQALSQVNSSVERIRNSLLEAHSKTNKELTASLLSFLSDLEKIVEFSSTDVKSTLSNRRNELSENKQSVVSQLDGEVSGVETVFGQLQEKIASFSEESASKISELLDEGVNRLGNVLKSTLDEFFVLTKDTVLKNYEALEDKLSATLREAMEITEEIKNETLGVASGLLELSEGQKVAKPAKIMTAAIVGEEAVKEYMRDMVSRVKRGITFLAPEKSFIPVEDILSLPMTAQVTIVTRIDKMADREWIKKLFGAKANVIIRQLSERSGTGTLPNFIGCEREGEEILLGTIDEDSKEIVAIVSMSSYFTKILGNIVIAEYARGRSVQLQRSEFGV